MSDAQKYERRSRTVRSRPGPEGRIAKRRKRARPSLGVITLFHYQSGEERGFHPVDANRLLEAGTWLREPPKKPAQKPPEVVAVKKESAPAKKRTRAASKPEGSDVEVDPNPAGAAAPDQEKTDGR